MIQIETSTSQRLTGWVGARIGLLAAFIALVASANASAQWNPYLPPQRSQHAIMGRVVALGSVVDEQGRLHLVEYDGDGVEVRRFPLENGIHVEPASVWNNRVDEWLAARTEYEARIGAGSTLTLEISDYENSERSCLDANAEPTSVPQLPDGTQWVLVANPSVSLPTCDDYVLAVSSISLDERPDVRIEDTPTLLLDASSRIITQADPGNFIALESGYFTAQAGLCAENPAITSNVLRNLVAYNRCAPANMDRIWAPVFGAEMSTTSNLSDFAAVSSGTGFYRLDYSSYATIDDWSGEFVFGHVDLDAFNPRLPSSRRFYLKKRLTGTGTVRLANFAVDIVQMSVTARLTNDGIDPVPLVDPDFQFDEFTEFNYSPPDLPENEPYTYSFENLPQVDFRDLGLLEQISAIDLQETDVYVYRVSDGKLVGARRGMKVTNLLGIEVDPTQFPNAKTPAGCQGSACLGFVMLTRGPASFTENDTSIGGTAPFQSAFADGSNENQVGLELEYLSSNPRIDFLRPDDTVQVIVVNRVTGYLGSLNGVLAASPSGQLAVRGPNGSPDLQIDMHPPNLRVEAKRRFEVGQGQTQGEQREYVIGFEGASLNTDQIVEITTEWTDHDGTPLPEDLPGFTGRLASVVEDELVAEGDAVETPLDQVGHFSISPGRHTTVARIPTERVDIGHLYVHVDAAPSSQTVDFQNARLDARPSFAVNRVCYWSNDRETCFDKPPGDSPNPLEERPAHLVPFKVPVFDEGATRDATELQRRALQQAWNEGDTLPILEQVDPIYQWLYRPEFKFSVLDLDVRSTEVVADDAGVRFVVDYALVGGNASQQLDPLGDSEFVFSLGYAELLATILDERPSGPDEVNQVQFDNLSAIQGQTPGEQLSSQADVLGAILSPEDFLVLQLYLQHDSSNGLFEFAFGSSLNLIADVRTLVLERLHRRARYDHHAVLPEVPAYRDSYEFLRFQVMNESLVDVVVIDQDGVETTLLQETNLAPNRYRFIIDYEQISNVVVDPRTKPRFQLEIRTEHLDENGVPVKNTIVYEGLLREREQGEIVGQSVVNDVVIADGSLRLEREDFRVAGAGPGLAFVRTYSSANPTEGPFGQGWSLELSHKLVPIEAGEPLSTLVEPGAVPQWVRDLKGGFFDSNERPPIGQEWIEVAVNGTRFRKFGTKWYPERGRHGMLQEVPGMDPETAKPSTFFEFTAMDGTRYRYRIPALQGEEPDTAGEEPDPNVVPVTVADAAVYRIGLLPLEGCALAEDVLDITAPNGHSLEYEYSAGGSCGDRVVGIVEKDVDGAKKRSMALGYADVSIFEDGATEPSRSVIRLGSVSGPGGIEVSFAYDAAGQLKSATRGNRTETYAYSNAEDGLVLLSASIPPGTADPTQTFAYAYHQKGELPLEGTQFGEHLRDERIVKTVTLPDPAASQVQFTYDFDVANEREVIDARGNPTAYKLDDVGRPIRIEAPLGNTTLLAWDLASGWIDSRTENLGTENRVTTFDYVFDPDSRLLSTTETGPLSNTRVTEFDPRFNRPTTRIDLNGFTESWTYDNNGNPTAYTDGASQQWIFMYDTQNLLRERKAPGHQSPTRFRYDANGYVAATTSPLGFVTETLFDARGRLMQRTDANNHTTHFTYDSLDNLSAVERPAISTLPGARGEALANRSALFRTDQITTWDALGRKVSETDHNGLTLNYAYDGRGLVTEITRSVDTASQSFTYDPNGNLLTETDWKSQTTTHTYDALNRRDTTTNRENDQVTFAYNPVGDLLEQVDFAGVTTTNTYDALSRRTSMEVIGRGTDGAKVTWTYFNEADAARNVETVTVDRSPLSAAVTTFEINGRYQPLRRINPDGDAFDWAYNADGTLERETDEAGLVTRHEYDDDSRRIATHVDAASGTLTSRFEPDPVGNTTATVDPLGRRVTRSYDEWNRAYRAEVEHSGGAYVTETLLDGEGNVLNVRDPRGHDRSGLRDALGRVTDTVAGDGARVTFGYDANDNVIEERVFVSGRSASSAATGITYDGEDRPVCRTEAKASPDEREQCVVSYDGVGNPVVVNDYLGEPTTFTYDANSRVVETLLPGGLGDETVISSYTRNGLLLSQTDPRTNTTSFTYDALGRLEQITDPVTPLQTERRFYDEVGNAIRVVDRRGIETLFRYDDLYRLRQVERAGQLISVFGYDGVGNLRFEQDANCNRVDYCYDERNLQSHAYFPTGPTANGAGCSGGGTDRGLDGCSAPAGTDVVARSHDAAGNLSTLTNEANQVTMLFYDEEDRVTSQAFAGETTAFSYDETGRLRFRTRPENNALEYRYDMVGRLAQSIEGGLLATSHSYDDNGNLLSSTLASGAIIEFTYDARNRVETQTQGGTALSLTTTFGYDAADNMTTLTDANLRAISYEYDDLNRRKRATYPTVAGDGYQVNRIDWTYDGNDNVLSDTLQKTDPTGASFTDITTYTYDNLDRLTVADQRGAPVTFGYDLAGRRTSVSLGTSSTTYGYDGRDRLRTVNTPAGPIAYGYKPDGRPETMTHANGVVTSYGYNAQNRLTSLTHEAGGQLIAQHAYDYDQNGNRTRETASLLGGTDLQSQTRLLGYDSADRLCAVAMGPVGPDSGLAVTVPDCGGAVGPDLTGIDEQLYAFNGYNRASETKRSNGAAVGTDVYGYDSANRLTTVTHQDSLGATVGISNYGYDNNGNTLSITDSRAPGNDLDLAYNIRDQLVRVTRGPPGSEVTLGRYDYDAQGQRVRNEALGDLTDSVYDGRQLLQVAQGGIPQAFVHWGGGGQLLAVTPNGTPTQTQHTDVLGSPVATTSGSGSVISTSRYSVFGELQARTDTPEGAAPSHYFGFTGHQYDEATELVYANARYYQPGLGRFLTQDSFLGRGTDPASLHRYLYAAHSPMVLVDPTGNFAGTQQVGEGLEYLRTFATSGSDDINAFKRRHGFWLGGILGGSGAVATGVGAGLFGTAEFLVKGLDATLDFATSGLLESSDQRTLARVTEGIAVVEALQQQEDVLGTIGEAAIDAAQRAFIEGDARAQAGVGEIVGGGFSLPGVGAAAAATRTAAKSTVRLIAKGTRKAAQGLAKSRVVQKTVSSARSGARTARAAGGAAVARAQAGASSTAQFARQQATRALARTREIASRVELAGSASSGRRNLASRLRSDEAFTQIDRLRRKVRGMEPLGDRIPKRGDGLGTVALVEAENGARTFAGLNSSLLGDKSKDLARTAFEGMQSKGLLAGAQRFGQGASQVLTHAETHALLRASSRGRLGRRARLFVDRNTCANCRVQLPEVIQHLGLEELEIIMKSGRTITIK